MASLLAMVGRSSKKFFFSRALDLDNRSYEEIRHAAYLGQLDDFALA
jgi:hypothetical protein